MGQHGSKGNITDALDILDRSIELIIDNDTTLVVHFHTNSGEVQAFNVRATANGDKNDIGF